MLCAGKDLNGWYSATRRAVRGSDDLVQATLRVCADEPRPAQDTIPVDDSTPVSRIDRPATHQALGWDPAPRYIIRDRDGACGEVLKRRLRAMGNRDRATAPQSP